MYKRQIVKKQCWQCHSDVDQSASECKVCGCHFEDNHRAQPRIAKPKNGLGWVTLTGEAAQIETDLDGKILKWNRAAEKLLGYSAAEAIGQHVGMLFPPGLYQDDLPSLENLKLGPVDRYESVRVRKDGTPIDVSVTLSAVQGDRGQLAGVTAIYFEIGDEVQSSLDLRSAQPDAPKIVALPKAPRATGKLSVLLATAASGGTIAAVRALGQRGIDVGVMASQPLSPAKWSNAGVRSYRVPLENDPRFLDRLLAIGAANPGQILLPTSDETAWMYTLNAERLKRHFRLYQPSIESMQRILDKKLFAGALTKAGLPVLPSWEPRTFAEVLELAPTLPYPILIKPRTHVHRVRNDKGMVAHSKTELIEDYKKFVDRELFRAAGDKALLMDADLPVLQQFVSVAEEGVYSITGFIDRTGELFVTRRSTKVFQRSKPVGVGICFESLPADPELSNAVRRLCRELNYFGMFEVEFLKFERGWAAIDFNARLFNQIGMDIRRGMPLPLFACLDAIGDTEALKQAIAEAQAVDQSAPTVFCDGFTLRAILTARTLTGRISRKELSHWRDWIKQHAAHMVDFAADAADPMPGFIHKFSEIYLGLKAFPRFLSSMPRISPAVAHVSAKVQP